MWEWGTFDFYIRNRPSSAQDKKIVIVGIDEADVHRVGQAILPDEIYASLLTKLKAMQPRAISKDIYQDLPVNLGHEKLEKFFQETTNLVGIQKVVGDERREGVAPPPVLAKKRTSRS